MVSGTNLARNPDSPAGSFQLSGVRRHFLFRLRIDSSFTETQKEGLLCFAKSGRWWATFFAANHRPASNGLQGVNLRQSQGLTCSMNAKLIAAASKVIPSTDLLVNVVSRRVRQLTLGHRPLVVVPPGMLAADIALTEIIEGKLTSQPAVSEDRAEAHVVPFPGTFMSGKKAA
jgi:DNA-directed RNA polymerase subunit omega